MVSLILFYLTYFLVDQEEEDLGGKIEFGFSDASFSKDIEDYFLLFEDECSQSHICAGRVMGGFIPYQGESH